MLRGAPAPAEASASVAAAAVVLAGGGEVHDLFHAVAENVASPECIVLRPPSSVLRVSSSLSFSARSRSDLRRDVILDARTDYYT